MKMLGAFLICAFILGAGWLVLREQWLSSEFERNGRVMLELMNSYVMPDGQVWPMKWIGSSSTKWAGQPPPGIENALILARASTHTDADKKAERVLSWYSLAITKTIADPEAPAAREMLRVCRAAAEGAMGQGPPVEETCFKAVIKHDEQMKK